MLKAESKGTMDWCHPAPECEDTGPAPGLRWYISHPGTATPVLEISPQPQSSITVFANRTSLGRNKSQTTEVSQRKFLDF